ncbi:hypothetical protein FIA58_008425 [Flavobacterium jejuense]|uniref:Uncharacterized protein n=1 Tax=Flavobacterium jejuense TaxID=1544455 RepID=A0ABX0IPF4_9FLAO|nr:hypothetical protein [Flavobacterium jejuense]NHN25702.1 hypothetical protein [Flavobacterium jejuense]
MKFDKTLYIQFILFVIVIFLANLLIVSIFQLETKFEKTTYSLRKMLVFFTVSSLVLLVIHDFIRYKNKDILGYVFMATLTVKVILTYTFIAPVLKATVVNSFEKTYFFCLFIVYLFVDVYFTVRLLNKKT